MAAEARAAVLTALADNGWIADDAVLAVERASRDGEWRWPAGFEATRSRVYGEAAFWYGRRRADSRLRPGASNEDQAE